LHNRIEARRSGNFDFRSVVANNIDLLWHQAHNLGEGYADLKFFSDEFCPMLANAVGGSNTGEKTVVTPFVHKWFDDIFPQHLMPLEAPDQNIEAESCCEGEYNCTPYLVIQSDQEYQQYKIIDHSKTPYFECCMSEEDQLYEKVTIDGVTLNVGDAVEIQPDESCSNDRWLCYITELKREGRNGVFRLVWLYTRKQTILCNLKKDVGKKNKKETDGAFLTFQKEMLNFKGEGLICGCKRRRTSRFDRFTREYEVGDCILINPQKGDITDLYTVCCIECIDTDNEIVKLRRFYRFCEVSEKNFRKVPVNELLYSDYVFDFNRYRSVVRACHVEFIEFGKPLPVNILHKGSGNHFYFSRKYDRENKSIRPIKLSKTLFSKFPDYNYKVGHIDRLNGLDLFCGGGSLGRGFEDAGVVKCKWAIDKDSAALKTYRHNAQGDDINIINESVNRILTQAILGTGDTQIPDKDEVDIILAGSPCQGFSYMNKHKENQKSQSNNSLVASVASFVDHYQPRYILLENVARIAQTEVFMRLFACLLDLGYQIRFNVVSAAHLGCVQIRNRIFLWGAAKGEVLPEMPPMTHHYSKRSLSHRELVSMGNTLRLQGFQCEKYSSFPMVTIKDLIGDLPEIDTGIYWDPAYPDHRTHYTSLKSKEILRRVPIDPPMSDYYYARKLNIIPNIHSHASYDAKMKKYPLCNYKYCQRVDRDDVFITIFGQPFILILNVLKYPQIVHYLEPRVISVREAARAQGFLETDILCGRVSDQYRVVGNSVPRNVAFSLGLQLCRAMTDPNHKSNPRNLPIID
ncbi:15620_t:CDS:10, partial [Acaulospora morrowiae]